MLFEPIPTDRMLRSALLRLSRGEAVLILRAAEWLREEARRDQADHRLDHDAPCPELQADIRAADFVARLMAPAPGVHGVARMRFPAISCEDLARVLDNWRGAAADEAEASTLDELRARLAAAVESAGLPEGELDADQRRALATALEARAAMLAEAREIRPDHVDASHVSGLRDAAQLLAAAGVAPDRSCLRAIGLDLREVGRALLALYHDVARPPVTRATAMELARTWGVIS